MPPPAVSTDVAVPGEGLHRAARKLLLALAQHAPARFTWGQVATLAGLKPSGGHFNAGAQEPRGRRPWRGKINGSGSTSCWLQALAAVPPAPSTPTERLALCAPTGRRRRHRDAAHPGCRRRAFLEADDVGGRNTHGKKPTGGHWNSAIAAAAQNGLIEADGRRYRVTTLFRE